MSVNASRGRTKLKSNTRYVFALDFYVKFNRGFLDPNTSISFNIIVDLVYKKTHSLQHVKLVFASYSCWQ